MYRAVQKAVSGEHAYTQQDQDDVEDRFYKLTKRKTPHVKLEDLRLKDLGKGRGFGPYTERGECELEPYSRCFNVIQYLVNSINNSNWPARFGSKKWDEPTGFSLDDVPEWMRNREDIRLKRFAPDQAMTLPNQPPPKPIVNVEVTWNSKAKTRNNQELIEHLIEEGFEMDDLITNASIDILPDATVAEVRDSIRAAFKLDTLGAQIRTMVTVPNETNAMQQKWSVIQEEI